MTKQPDFQIKERNFSGVTQLYAARPSRAYVVEVGLRGNVRGSVLQAAIEATLRRMPYFSDSLVERGGKFFYAVNPLPMEAKETDVLRAVGGPETNWHMVDVTYWNDTVWFSMFHGFCDGLGLNMFIEATLYHYFCLRDGKKYAVEGIRTEDTPILPGEELDPYAADQPLPEGYQPHLFAEAYWHLPEMDEKRLDHMLGVPVRVREDAFIRFVKDNGCTPAAMLHLLMAHAVQAVHPENEQTIGALLPASWRPELSADNTFKNCATALRLPYRIQEMQRLSFGDQARAARALLRQGRNPELARYTANILGGTQRQLDAVMHSFRERAAVLDFMKTSNGDSYAVDYVGGLKAGEYRDEIVRTRYMATNLHPNFRAMTLYPTATAGPFHIEIVRSCESDVYVEAFLDQLRRHGLAFEREPESRYLTPENGLIPGLGLV